MIHTDPSRSHATYAPSSAHRWTVCTASAVAISKLPEQEEGEAAAKGTAAHEELERCLSVTPWLDVNPDHESAYGIALALAYLRGLPVGEMWVEQRVALTDQIWGRCDVAHWDATGETLTIIDLKDGFVDVDAVENEQLRIYGAGSIYTHKLPAKWIRYVVVQPNSIVPGPRVKQWLESAEDLHAFASKTAAIPAGPLTFVAGESCKYCPLFGLCPASQDVLLRLNAVLANPPDSVPDSQVAIFTALKKPIEDWFKSLDKAATKKALSGAVPAGMKLVTTTTKRAWKDEAAARAAIVAAKGVEALEPPTPAQAEKLGIDIEGLTGKPEGGPALAFASDRRPEWKPRTASEMFAAVVPVVRS